MGFGVAGLVVMLVLIVVLVSYGVLRSVWEFVVLLVDYLSCGLIGLVGLLAGIVAWAGLGLLHFWRIYHYVV